MSAKQVDLRTADGIRLARRALGLSARMFSHVLWMKGSARTIYKWERGEVEVPGPISKLVRYILMEARLWPLFVPAPLSALRHPGSEPSPDE